MLARIRKSQEDEGFTLIELLVVMIIIGILAAIAIPVFLNQRKKANDTAGKADVSTLGKEIATFFVDGTALTAAQVTNTSSRYQVAGADAGKSSNNIALGAFHPTAGATTQTPATSWCVDVVVTGGTQTAYRYSAANGLVQGACATTDYP